MPLPNPIYVSNPTVLQPATAAAIKPCGPPILSSPFPGVATEFILEQEFMCVRNKFVPLALDTAYSFHAEFSTFILCAESAREDAGAGFVRWKRTYAKLPDNAVPLFGGIVTCAHYEQIGYSYQFIGFNFPGRVREPFSEQIGAIKAYDYFLLAPGDQVELLPAQAYYTKIASDPADQTVKALLLTGAGTAAETVPTYQTYKGWVDASTPIIPEQSQPFRWLGNIWGRETIYIIPQ